MRRGGAVYEHNSIYQFKNDVPENGHRIDHCESNGDAGGWMINMAIKPTAPALSADLATNIIDSYLKPHWERFESERKKAEQEGRASDADAWMQLRDWQPILANSLRDAAGLSRE
ncbi:hypothetical protein [Paenibacillus piri]|uniref:Uncharacterized protein n=1 Tax=Paenibacillus piri TaxID=2547395 RepID=A0A4R5KR52_9BACL|nr:hypothetical protein [Paenibacillus piri]TDF98273.1 hypothetical protein E1757_12325 [Paenibacillus piri]